VEFVLGARYSDVEQSTFFWVVGTNGNESLLKAGNYNAGPLQSLS